MISRIFAQSADMPLNCLLIYTLHVIKRLHASHIVPEVAFCSSYRCPNHFDCFNNAGFNRLRFCISTGYYRPTASSPQDKSWIRPNDPPISVSSTANSSNRIATMEVLIFLLVVQRYARGIEIQNQTSQHRCQTLNKFFLHLQLQGN